MGKNIRVHNMERMEDIYKLFDDRKEMLSRKEQIMYGFWYFNYSVLCYKDLEKAIDECKDRIRQITGLPDKVIIITCMKPIIEKDYKNKSYKLTNKEFRKRFNIQDDDINKLSLKTASLPLTRKEKYDKKLKQHKKVRKCESVAKRRRKVAFLRFFKNNTLPQIAKIMKVSLSTIERDVREIKEKFLTRERKDLNVCNHCGDNRVYTHYVYFGEKAQKKHRLRRRRLSLQQCPGRNIFALGGSG